MTGPLIPYIFPVLSAGIAVTSQKDKFVILIAQLCPEGIVDQNVPAANDRTDPSDEVFRTDSQVNTCSVFQIRASFLVGRIDIDNQSLIPCETFCVTDTFYEKIIVGFSFSVILHKL